MMEAAGSISDYRRLELTELQIALRAAVVTETSAALALHSLLCRDYELQGCAAKAGAFQVACHAISVKSSSALTAAVQMAEKRRDNVKRQSGYVQKCLDNVQQDVLRRARSSATVMPAILPSPVLAIGCDSDSGPSNATAATNEPAGAGGDGQQQQMVGCHNHRMPSSWFDPSGRRVSASRPTGGHDSVAVDHSVVRVFAEGSACRAVVTRHEDVYRRGVAMDASLVPGRFRFQLTATLDDAHIVWELDRLETFRQTAWDPYGQAINRMSPTTERALCDKATLARLVWGGDFGQRASNLSDNVNKLGLSGAGRQLVAAALETLRAYVPLALPLQSAQDFLLLATGSRKPPLCTGPWILKRAELASGFGHRILSEPLANSLPPASMQQLADQVREQRAAFVLQRYISRPLLIKGLKFDCRMYLFLYDLVMVPPPGAEPNWAGRVVPPTRRDPAEAALSIVAFTAPAFVRFCTESYVEGDYGNPHRHIANIARNRANPTFGEEDGGVLASLAHTVSQPSVVAFTTSGGITAPIDPPRPGSGAAEEGSRLPGASPYLHSFDVLRNVVSESQYHSITNQMRQCARCLVDGIVRPEVAREATCSAGGPPPSLVFSSQLFGLDFTLDHEGQPWLTECQLCPALGLDHRSDAVLLDVLSLMARKAWHTRTGTRHHSGPTWRRAELLALSPL